MSTTEKYTVPPPPVIKTGELIPLSRARNRITAVWFIGGGVILALLVALSFGTTYSKHQQDLWAWALPCLMPTAGLILSVLVADAIVKPGVQPQGVWVNRFFYRLALALTFSYMVIMLVSIVVSTLVASVRDGFEAMDGLRMSSYWLSVFQGLVAASLGGLFFTADKEAKS